MSDFFSSFDESSQRNTSRFWGLLHIFEILLSFFCIILVAAFVFTGVIVERNSLWWIGIAICSTMWFFSFRKHRHISIEQCDDNESTYQTIFFCILFAGIAIRFTLALTMLPALKDDCVVLTKSVREWSKGNIIETKSLMQTAFYAFWQWMFGYSKQFNQIINVFLGGLQIFLAFDLTKKLFKRSWIAIVSAAITAFHPLFVCLTLGLYTELLFGVFMLLSFRSFFILFERIEKCLYDKHTIVESIKLALYCLGLFYTRGNGAFLILICWATILLFTKFNRNVLVKVFLPNFATTILVLILVGILNINILGHFVVSSSEDSYWPLLYGSCVKSKGECSKTDADLIYSQYYDLHPKMRGKYVPKHELAPFIRKEFLRRWRENTQQMIELGILKYKKMWGDGDYWICWYLTKPGEEFDLRRWDLLFQTTKRIKSIEAICLVCWLIILPKMQSASRRTVFIMLLFLFLNIINHFFVEALIRYSYPLIVTLSILAPGIMLFWAEKNQIAKKNYSDINER